MADCIEVHPTIANTNVIAKHELFAQKQVVTIIDGEIGDTQFRSIFQCMRSLCEPWTDIVEFRGFVPKIEMWCKRIAPAR